MVVILEFQVRFQAVALRYRALSTAVAAGIYCGLAAVALIWLLRTEWFSAYDALLWLLAFVTIEINVLEALQRRRVTARTAESVV